MNEIAYDLLLDVAVKRKITILTLLLEADSPRALADIAKICDVSQKTLSRDAQDLIHLFPNLIIFEKSSLFLASQSDSNPLLSYIENELKNNILFSIVEDTFYARSESIEYLSEKFFIAESTLRKHLNVLKKVLKKFNLTLNLSPIEILGDEINIRYFYSRFFEQDPDFIRNNHPETLYTFLKSLTHAESLILNVDYHRLICWAAVIEQRIKQSKTVYLKPEILEKYSNTYTISAIRTALNKSVETPLYNQFSNSEIIFVFLISLDALGYDEKSNFFPEGFLSEMELFENVANQFFQDANLTYSLNFELKSIIKAFLINEKVLQDLSPLFQKNNSKFQELIEKKYPRTFSIWNTILENDNTFVYKKDLAASLTSLTEARMTRSRNILFVVSGNPAETTYYRYLANKYIPKTDKLFFISDQPIDEMLIGRLNIDIFISNFPLEYSNLNCMFFKFSRVPLEREWLALSKMLNKF